MSIGLYTAQECEWLKKVLNLFEIEATVTKMCDAMWSYSQYEFKVDQKTEDMIKRLMMFNYERNFK